MQVKDLLCTNGVPTTCASRMLAEYVPVYDATAVARLRQQDAVLLGKGNMDEFGMGSSTENSAFFPHATRGTLPVYPAAAAAARRRRWPPAWLPTLSAPTPAAASGSRHLSAA